MGRNNPIDVDGQFYFTAAPKFKLMNNQLPSLQVVNAQLIHQTLSHRWKKAATSLNRDREDAGSTCLAQLPDFSASLHRTSLANPSSRATTTLSLPYWGSLWDSFQSLMIQEWKKIVFFMCVTFLEGERKSLCTGSFIDNSVSHFGLFSWLGVLKWATNCITSQVLGPSAPLTRVGFSWLPQIPSCFWEKASVPCWPSSCRFPVGFINSLLIVATSPPRVHTSRGFCRSKQQMAWSKGSHPKLW